MRADVARDLTASAVGFQRVVWPQIRQACGGGDLIPVEAVTATTFAKTLDMAAGIDAWQITHPGGIRGIASRVQWVSRGRAWNSFTIRAQRDTGTTTEYEKRCAALDGNHGWLYPHLTVQGYVEHPAGRGALLSCAVIRTADLIRLIQLGECEQRRTHNASFYVVWWTRATAFGAMYSQFPSPRVVRESS